MKYRIQTFYPLADCFINTNHESNDLEQLKRFAQSDTFAGFRIRIIDDTGALRFAPPARQRQGEPTLGDIAAMLDVPIPPDETDEEDKP